MESSDRSLDSQILDWQEQSKAQVWYDKYSNKWTLFIPQKNGYPIQPSESTLRAVLLKGWELHRQEQP